MKLPISTNQQLVQTIKVLNFFIACFNLICFFLTWFFINEIYRFFIERIPNNYQQILNLGIGIAVCFSLLILVVIPAFLLSLYLGRFKIQWLQLYNLIFLLPLGLVTFYYLIQKHYWLVENPNQRVNWSWTRESEISEINDQSTDNTATGLEKKKYRIIVQTGELLQKAAQKPENQFLKRIVDHLFGQKTLRFNLFRQNFDQILVLRAILDVVNSKNWRYVVFNIPDYLGIKFAFGLSQKANRQQALLKKRFPNIDQYYFQLFTIHNVLDHGYDQVLKTKAILEENRRDLTSFFIVIYTTKVFKTFFNQPRKF